MLRDAAPDRSAIAAPGMTDLTYGGLLAQCGYVQSSLNAAGIGADECVAIVVPNGPAMGAAFLAVANCTTAAPLNPAYKRAEFESGGGGVEGYVFYRYVCVGAIDSNIKIAPLTGMIASCCASYRKNEAQWWEKCSEKKVFN